MLFISVAQIWGGSPPFGLLLKQVSHSQFYVSLFFSIETAFVVTNIGSNISVKPFVSGKTRGSMKKSNHRSFQLQAHGDWSK